MWILQNATTAILIAITSNVPTVPKMTFSKYNENYIADAILALTEKGVSLVRAARQYDVPKSTFSGRMKN
jgi:hypothetical protein